MATKTFEELKQMAIQIRDEKTNKQNTATRIGTQMLEHLNKLEQDFLDKNTTEGKFSELYVNINKKNKYYKEVDLNPSPGNNIYIYGSTSQYEDITISNKMAIDMSNCDESLKGATFYARILLDKDSNNELLYEVKGGEKLIINLNDEICIGFRLWIYNNVANGNITPLVYGYVANDIDELNKNVSLLNQENLTLLNNSIVKELYIEGLYDISGDYILRLYKTSEFRQATIRKNDNAICNYYEYKNIKDNGFVTLTEYNNSGVSAYAFIDFTLIEDEVEYIIDLKNLGANTNINNSPLVISNFDIKGYSFSKRVELNVNPANSYMLGMSNVIHYTYNTKNITLDLSDCSDVLKYKTCYLRLLYDKDGTDYVDNAVKIGDINNIVSDKTIIGLKLWIYNNDSDGYVNLKIKTIGINNEDYNSNYKSKALLAIGASSVADGRWQRKVGELLCMSVSTHAKGGATTIQVIDGDGGSFPALSDDDVRGIDCIALWLGGNDIGYEFGNITDMYPANTTLEGVCNYAIKKVYEHLSNVSNMTCKILIIAPHCDGKYEWRDVTGYEENAQGRSIKEMSERICKVAAYNNLPYINLWEKSGIGKYTWGIFTNYTSPYSESYIPSDGINNGTNKPFESLLVAPDASQNNGKYITVGSQTYKSNGQAWVEDSVPYPWNSDQHHLNTNGYDRVAYTIAGTINNM